MTGKVSESAYAGGLAVGWVGWFVSHLAQINSFLQFLLLVASIAATCVAARYHWRKTPREDK